MLAVCSNFGEPILLESNAMAALLRAAVVGRSVLPACCFEGVYREGCLLFNVVSEAIFGEECKSYRSPLDRRIERNCSPEIARRMTRLCGRTSGDDRSFRQDHVGEIRPIPGRQFRRYFGTIGDCSESVEDRSAPVIAVGLSGGVDSSVAALLLKRQGFKVFGVYMRNWDPTDEAGVTACSAEQDYEDARQVSKHLGIEFYEVDNQRRYWTDVFESFTSDFSMGLTPNPDLACNRYIKFDALLEQAKELGADKLATGHYARLHSADGQHVQLLRGIDYEKDQSYFLASVAGTALQKVLFPLGPLIKSDVRKLAASEGLITAKKRSSAGICFVGRRNFTDFISEYVDLRPGPFIAVDTGAVIGTHVGIPAYTYGQRARIGGKTEAWYVVGKDVPNNSVFVAGGPEHSALFCGTALADSLSWISGALPAELAKGRVLKCLYKARYRQPAEECIVCLSNAETEGALREGMGAAFMKTRKFMPSSLCRLQSVPVHGEQLQIKFLKPARAVTPGQALVLYDGDVCLGAARFLHPGPSVFELECDDGQRQAGDWLTEKFAQAP